jgi:Spy/CpxP family protein refolding chaperone
MNAKSICVKLGVAALVVASVSAARAQPQGGQGRGMGMFGGMGGDPSFLLSIEPIQKELTLTEEQKTKVGDMAQENRDAMQDIFQMAPEERTKKLQERATANRKKIADLLQKPQMERLDEISLQMAMQNGGAQLATLLMRSDVAEKVNLAADQKKKLEDLVADNTKKMQEIRDNNQGDFQGMREAMTKLQTEQKDKITAALTSEQKDKLEKLQGKKFDLTSIQMGRGFGGKKGGNQ